jgi:hypothetical protein
MFGQKVTLEDSNTPRSPPSLSKSILTQGLGLSGVRRGWGLKERVFIGGGGLTYSKKVANGLKLLSKIVNECSSTITQWMVQAYIWGIAHWLKDWSTSAHSGPTSVRSM